MSDTPCDNGAGRCVTCGAVVDEHGRPLERQATRAYWNTCTVCWNKFDTKRPDAAYCSDACRMKMYRARKRARQP